MPVISSRAVSDDASVWVIDDEPEGSVVVPRERRRAHVGRRIFVVDTAGDADDALRADTPGWVRAPPPRAAGGIVAMTLFHGDDRHLIAGWVRHCTAALGIAHFFFYCNDVVMPPDLPRLPNVSYVHYPYTYALGAQVAANNDFLACVRAWREPPFIYYGDLDEFPYWSARAAGGTCDDDCDVLTCLRADAAARGVTRWMLLNCFVDLAPPLRAGDGVASAIAARRFVPDRRGYCRPLRRSKVIVAAGGAGVDVMWVHELRDAVTDASVRGDDLGALTGGRLRVMAPSEAGFWHVRNLVGRTRVTGEEHDW